MAFQKHVLLFYRIRPQHTTTKVGATGSTTTREEKNNIMKGFFLCGLFLQCVLSMDMQTQC